MLLLKMSIFVCARSLSRGGREHLRCREVNEAAFSWADVLPALALEGENDDACRWQFLRERRYQLRIAFADQLDGKNLQPGIWPTIMRCLTVPGVLRTRSSILNGSAR